MTLDELDQIRHFDKVKVHSLATNLYHLSVIVAGEEHVVNNAKGQSLTSHNKLELQRLFKNKKVDNMVLCQQSAYDEMVGQPPRDGANSLEVPLGNTGLS